MASETRKSSSCSVARRPKAISRLPATITLSKLESCCGEATPNLVPYQLERRATTWNYGDQIALRYRWRNDLAWVHSVTVVEDSPQCIALFEAMNTPIKMP